MRLSSNNTGEAMKIVCRQCGRSFQATRSWSLCSDLCRRDRKNEIHRERYHSDPAWKWRSRASTRKLRADPDYRARINAEERQRRLDDPSYREKTLERSRVWARAKKAADPAYRRLLCEKQKIRAAKKSAILAYVKELGIISIGDFKS